ncbi:MAG: bifunctional 23S rRNA (guanine(2069)-N(7))-methyltransferase RlmK/23S rRNA (guanine(2445)-N(2))-methyltransferase RlmL [Gammaproteobacteria bacterium]|nr:bifunctional 23S rRNA (guanine(2069)-N(7))-methyltransferase RlmK/23S rRNA (guanine(2445)-N(2))-methyltransferase RlmL [Gammaproteobacteria bacterium]
MPLPDNTQFFAAAPKGMTTPLALELLALGAYDVRETNAGVSFAGNQEIAYRVCLWSRVANRVLMPIAKLRAATPEQLYDGVKAIAWENHMDVRGTLAVECTAVSSVLTHTHYAALKTKDAIVDRMRDLFGERPSVDVEQPDLRINLHLRNDQARISLDLSGGSLHRRGYRSAGAHAPLKENLAAAILLLADWPAIARAGGPLLDPLCGSATLLIEGAWIAGDVAPGLMREHYGFLGWRGHDPELWGMLLREAQARRTRGLENLPSIRGYDGDAEAVQAALLNVESAGLLGKVHIERRTLGGGKPESASAPGLLAVNPPYGARLGNASELRTLYAQLGTLMRSLPAWHAAVFTGNPELAAYIGLRSQRAQEMFNGPIECHLFHYRVPMPSADAVPDVAQQISAGAEMFANRLRKNLKQSQRWAQREGVSCYRVYDGDLPEYALAVDLYHEAATAARHVHVQEYQAPSSIDPEKAQQRLQEALAVLPQVLDVPVERVYFKTRRRQKGVAQYEKFSEGGYYVEVNEGGLRFQVNFTDYLDTGLFLDHRPTRALLRELAQGKRFLNLFAYTGTASVYAAAGGARTTTTVDMSRTYLDWAQRNMARNGYTGSEHQFLQHDCLAWLSEQAQSAPGSFDLIFLDPPTFSNSKRMTDNFDVQRDHVVLLRDVLQLLIPGGVLVFSNNFRRFKLDGAALENVEIEDLTQKTIPKDFERNPRIHHCWKILKVS